MKLVVSALVWAPSRLMTANSSSAAFLSIASSPVAMKSNICEERFSHVQQMSDRPKSCSFSKLPLDSLLFERLCAGQGLLMTRIKYSSCSRDLCRSSSSLKGAWFITFVLPLGNMMGIHKYHFKDRSCYEICRAKAGNQEVSPAGKGWAGGGRGGGVPGVWGRGFPLSVCGADLGPQRVITRNPAGKKKLFPAR